jgi:hypothetical protein
LDVLLVVLAFEVLDLGSSGVGLLNSAVGAGAILGSALTVLLLGKRLVVRSWPGSPAGAWRWARSGWTRPGWRCRSWSRSPAPATP